MEATFVNQVKISQFKAEDCKLNAYPLCLGNISKVFTVDNMKERELNRWCVYDFSVCYEGIAADDIVDIYK